MSNNKPLVSVIMNCFNGEPFLKEAIETVYMQTYNKWEIIFWDNQSTDNSASIAKSFDYKLNYYKSKTKTVLGKARVNAVQRASGELLAFLDCDDLWSPNKLEKQVKHYINNPDIGIIYSRANIINEKGEKIGKIPDLDVLPHGNIFNNLVKSNFIPFVSALVSKKKYFECGGFPLNYTNATDYNLFLKISFTSKVIAITETTCMYRQHTNNLSIKTKLTGALESLEIVKNFLPHESARIGVKYQKVSLISCYIKELKLIEAFALIINNPITVFLLFKRFFKRFN